MIVAITIYLFQAVYTLTMVILWEILRDSYHLYLCNGQWSLHSFLQK